MCGQKMQQVSNRFWPFVLAVAFIAIAVSIAYSNILNAPFVFDDYHNIRQNSNIKIDNISLRSLYEASTNNPTPRPVAYISFAINYYFGGDNVRGYHLVNLFIHAFNGVLVFLLGQMVLAKVVGNGDALNDQNSKMCYWMAVSAALVFVLHPVQTQSVTYVVQRMTSLCSLFYLSSIFVFFCGRKTSSTRNRIVLWILAFVFWLLAIGTKQIAVTLPLAILLLDWVFFQDGKHDFRNSVRRYGGFVLATLAVMCIVAFVFKGVELPKLFTRGYARREFSLTERLLTEGRVMIHYLSLMCWPAPSRLTLVYDFPTSKSFFDPILTSVSWVLILTSLVLSIVFVDKCKMLSFAVLWFFLHLAVESTVIPLELVYEHRLYLPMFGVCLAVVFYCNCWIKHASFRFALLAILVFLLGAGTYIRNQAWHSEISIWSDNISKQPTASRGFHNLAIANARHGEFAKALTRFDEAIAIEPNLQAAHVRRGQILELRGDFRGAVESYSKAIEIPAQLVRGTYVIGDALASRGKAYNKIQELSKSLEDLSRAIEYNPNQAIVYVSRASTLSKLGEAKGAVDDYEMAIELAPNLVAARNNYCWMLATHPDKDIANPRQALLHGAKACELTSWQNHSTLASFAAAFARSGNFQKAQKWQAESAKIAPKSAKDSMLNRLDLYKNGRPFIANAVK